MQLIAVLLITFGFAAAVGSVAGVRPGVFVAGVVLTLGAAVFLLDIGGDE